MLRDRICRCWRSILFTKKSITVIFILLYQFFTGGFVAWFNYWLIKNNHFKNYYHAINGALHIAAAVLISYYTKWNYGVACLLYTRVVFDAALNIWRDKGLGYVSPAPASKIDQVEKWLVLRIAGIVHKKRTVIADEQIQWIAIYFRLFILLTATAIMIL